MKLFPEKTSNLLPSIQKKKKKKLFSDNINGIIYLIFQ